MLVDNWYKARIDSVALRPADRKTKKDAILDIVIETDGNENEVVNGVKLYRSQSCGEKSMFALKEIIEAANGKFEEGAEEAEVEFDDLEGSVVWVLVSTDDTYDGRPRNQIDRWAHIETPLNEAGEPEVPDTTVIVGGTDEEAEEETEEEESETPTQEPAPVAKKRR